MYTKKRVIIVGGGFGGLQLAQTLDTNLFDVLLIDKLNHHQFQPLFYQVATSQIEPSSISFPLRNIFKRNKNIQIRLANVEKIDKDSNIIYTSIGEFTFDYAIIAIGCKSNFFGNKNIEENVFTLKTTYEAIQIRNHILQTFEDIISSTGEKKESLSNIVIVGAGPTGVELAGAFAEIITTILPKDYPDIDFSGVSITLVEGSKHTLNNMSELAKNTSEKYLKKMGVKVFTETYVKNYDGNTIEFQDGRTIQTKTVIWAAGLIGNSIEGIPESSITFGKRILVNETNLVDGCTNIYAVGDIAFMATKDFPKAHPQVANVAINQGKNLAKNLKRLELNKPTVPYFYNDLGCMATIGRNKAVVDFKFIRFKGYFAWLVWMFLHLMLILSVRNKLIIFINWAWAYITKDTSLRLILKQGK